MPNPYAPPRALVAPPKERLPRTLQLAVHATIGLKAAQVAVSLWLWSQHIPLLWSAIDLALHFGGATLVLRGKRVAVVVWLVAAAWGLFVAMPRDRIIPARFLYLVLLPLVLVVLTLRHWRAFEEKA